MAGIPSPAVSPELHDTIGLGTLPRFPSRYPGVGCVKITIKAGAEVDKQKANGKNGVTSKLKGKGVASGTITFFYTTEIWDEATTLLQAIDPFGDGYGKVWEVSQPKLSKRRVNKVLFHDLQEQDSQGDQHSFSVDFDGWYQPAQAKTGGTSTPKTPERLKTGVNVFDFGSNGNVVNFGGSAPVTVLNPDGSPKLSVSGFDGPNAPDTKAVR